MCLSDYFSALPLSKVFLFVFYASSFKKIFVHLWLHWVFTAVCRLSLVAWILTAPQGLLIADFSCCGARVLGVRASVVVVRGVIRK